jgi:hypothetical protein
VAALEARDDWPFTLQESPRPADPQFRLIGESLTPYAGHPNGPDLAHYFAEAGVVRRIVGELLPGFEARVDSLFASMSGGRTVELPPGDQPGTHYAPSTIRHLPPGTEIPVHVGNYFRSTPAYRHLGTLVDLADQLSWFVTLQTPTAGGALVVFDAEYGKDEAPPMRRADRADWDVLGDRWSSRPFRPEAGDLLVFNGGRYYHRVSRIDGPRARWTIGGFAGFSPDGNALRYWS